MKILIAGGLGFLGINLIKKINSLNLNIQITCLDNLQTSYINNLNQIGTKTKFIEHDIKRKIEIDRHDIIFNLACPASPPLYQIDPIDTIKTSFIGTLNLLEMATKNKSRLIQASTSEVYGDPLMHPQNENYWGNVNPIGVRSCYDEGKRSAETLCMDFHRTKNTNVNIIRIFNTYGPYMRKDDGRVVSNFINAALKNEFIEIYGDGKQTRSFCYVDDLVNAFVKIIHKNDLPPDPINLGNPTEFDMNELSKIVIKLTQSKSKIIHKELPSDDPTKRKPNIDKAKKLLNWSPTVNLEQGLENTIEYFKSNL